MMTETEDTDTDGLDIADPSGEIGIVETDDSNEDYDYQLIDPDGHEFPIWPHDVENMKSLLDEFKAEVTSS